MTLVERINLMKEKVESLKVAKSGMSDASLFQARLEELRKISGPLKREVETLVLFNSEKFNLTKIPSSIGNAILRITSIRQRFETERKAAQLTKGQDWKLMREHVRETIHEIREDIRNIWRNYVEQAYSGESPTELSRILAPTNTNRNALSRYKIAYKKLSVLSQNIPTAREDFDQVKVFADELRTIRGDRKSVV